MTNRGRTLAGGLLLGLGACSTPAQWLPPDGPGPWLAGATTREVVDGWGKAMTVEVWYPVPDRRRTHTDGVYTELLLPGDFARDADPAEPPEGAHFPLVAFSHGNGGVRYQSAFLTEHLATHGFVVVAPDHPGDNLLEPAGDPLTVAEERPRDIVGAVDAILALAAGDDPLLAGLVADGAYAVAGHSFGAWTALVVGGGEVDAPGLFDWCAGGASDFCAFVAGGEPDDVAIEGAPDPRAEVVVALAPGGWYAFGDDGLAAVAPALVLAGDRDSVTPLDVEVEPTYARLGDPRALGVLEGAGHLSFTDTCVLGQLAPECAGEPEGYLDPDEAHHLTRALTTAWLGVYLVGDDRYQPWLEPSWRATQLALQWREVLGE